MKKLIQIAIDGPAAAGKSTIAKLMAKKLQYIYVDTGAMYRAITWKTLDEGIDVDDEYAVTNLLKKTEIVLRQDGGVLVNNFEVTDKLRESNVTTLVAKIATYEGVREELKKRQIVLANSNNVIMDGRDIGTNVLPHADFKFFMIADARIRALRRYKENLERGIESEIDQLEEEIKKRDEIDANRKYAPLKQAKDAILIDTSALSIHEVVDKMVGFVLK